MVTQATISGRCYLFKQFIALIEDPAVIRRILDRLGPWALRAMQRSPPLDPEAWPAHASRLLTYHPVPNVA